MTKNALVDGISVTHAKNERTEANTGRCGRVASLSGTEGGVVDSIKAGRAPEWVYSAGLVQCRGSVLAVGVADGKGAPLDDPAAVRLASIPNFRSSVHRGNGA